MRVSERVGGRLGLASCLALAIVIAVVGPDPATDVRRRYDDVKVGELASTAVVGALVTRVQLTRSARAAEHDEAWTSDQTLVVVSIEASVRRQVTQFDDVTLRTRAGVEYKPRDEFITAALAETAPGFTRLSTLVFEVPPDRVPGSKLVVDTDDAAFDAYAEAIRVDLDLRAPLSIAPSAAAVPDSTVRVT